MLSENNRRPNVPDMVVPDAAPDSTLKVTQHDVITKVSGFRKRIDRMRRKLKSDPFPDRVTGSVLDGLDEALNQALRSNMINPAEEVMSEITGIDELLAGAEQNFAEQTKPNK